MSKPTEPNDETLEQTLQSSRQLEDAPAWLVQRVIALAPKAAAASPLLGATVRRVLARLVADTGTAPALALGLRAAAPAGRHLLFAAEGRDIDLRLTPATVPAQGWSLAGQVLGPDWRGDVRLRGEDLDVRVTIDDSGEFRFGPLRAGRWQLTLESAGTQVELPPLEIPPP